MTFGKNAMHMPLSEAPSDQKGRYKSLISWVNSLQIEVHDMYSRHGLAQLRQKTDGRGSLIWM